VKRTLGAFTSHFSRTPAPTKFKPLKISLQIKVLLVVAALCLILFAIGGWGSFLGKAIIGAVACYYLFIVIRSRLPIMYRGKSRLDSQLVVITGGNRGIGQETALTLARLGAHVIIACRDTKKGEQVAADFKTERGAKSGGIVEVLPLDLTSFKSVRELADTLEKRKKKINILINNAGGMSSTSTTVDGLDNMWQINLLGHFFLLTNLLLKSSSLARRARIIHVSSLLHIKGHINFDDLFKARTLVEKYSNTKLAVVLFSNELQRRLNELAPNLNITSNSLHPGVVDTDFILHFIPSWLKALIAPLLFLICISPRAGAQTTLYAALSPRLDRIGGAYLDRSQICLPSVEARQLAVARRLWDKSEELVGLSPLGKKASMKSVTSK